MDPAFVEHHIWAQQQRGIALPDMDPNLLALVALTFSKDTAKAMGNVAPRAYSKLFDDALRALVKVFLECERTGRWPARCQLVCIVMLPKPDGGWRPIGIFHNQIRIWFRARSVHARRWEWAHERACLYAGHSRGAAVAAWRASFAAEAAKVDNQHVAQLLVDLVKAFEVIPHMALIRAAVKHGYSLVMLRLSLAAYRIKRIFIQGQCHI